MLVSVKSLKENNANKDCIKCFVEIFGENSEIDLCIVIKKFEEYKKYYFEWFFTNYKLTGECIEYYENGNKKWEKNYKNGKRDGEWICYFNDNKIKLKEKWKDGKRDGELVWFRLNGTKVCIENWENGKRRGKWISYDENGEIKHEKDYK